jgi:single-strand DNA-binding protein
MFDTNLVVVGNALTTPEWRRIASSGSLVANFRIASTSRRFDRENNRWVDGNNLRVRVTAWRRLAEGIASSIKVGDPVIVYGRLYTRDWTDDDNKPRVSYEMEAFSIGHDLARGRGRFFRHRSAPAGGAVEDAEAEAMIGGELSLVVPAEDAPIGFGEGMPLAAEVEPAFAETAAFPETAPVTASAEPVAVGPVAVGPVAVGPVAAAPVVGGAESGFLETAPPASAPVETEPDPAPGEPAPEGEPPTDDELTLEVERLVAEQPPAARRTRRSKREPVAA